MGLNVYNKVVAIDHTHQKRVDTSLEKNPTTANLDGLPVRHIFQRNKTGDKDRDGNPLIYALKGMNGYSIVPMYKRQFLERAAEIIDIFVAELDADYIMPLPSSYNFCAEVGALVSERAGIELLPPDFIRKRTASEMLAEYDGNVPKGLNRRSERIFKAQLASWRRLNPGQFVSMKKIENSIRVHFSPVTVQEGADRPTGKRVVIVDDLMSSGSSLISCATLLTLLDCEATSAVCFLSGLSR